MKGAISLTMMGNLYPLVMDWTGPSLFSSVVNLGTTAICALSNIIYGYDCLCMAPAMTTGYDLWLWSMIGYVGYVRCSMWWYVGLCLNGVWCSNWFNPAVLAPVQTSKKAAIRSLSKLAHPKARLGILALPSPVTVWNVVKGHYSKGQKSCSFNRSIHVNFAAITPTFRSSILYRVDGRLYIYYFPFPGIKAGQEIIWEDWKQEYMTLPYR